MRNLKFLGESPLTNKLHILCMTDHVTTCFLALPNLGVVSGPVGRTTSGWSTTQPSGNKFRKSPITKPQTYDDQKRFRCWQCRYESGNIFSYGIISTVKEISFSTHTGDKSNIRSKTASNGCPAFIYLVYSYSNFATTFYHISGSYCGMSPSTSYYY